MRTSRIRVNAYAKINLALRVTGTGPDRFHQLQTIFQSLALHDRLTLAARPGPFTLTCSEPAVPTGEENLVWQAAARLWTAIGRAGAPRDVRIALQKRIPVQAGLGGGSADAAAALVGLARLWCGGRTPPDLHKLAARIGADAAYFLIGGTAMGLGRGEDLYPLEDVVPMHVLLALPAFGVSTADAYRWFDESAFSSMRRREVRAERVAAWKRRELVVANDLEGPVARRHAEIARIRAAMHKRGAIASAMTGSGSAVFGLFDRRDRAAQARAGLARAGWRVILTRTLGREPYARGFRPAIV